MTVCSRFFHPLSLCVVAPFDLDGVPPRTLSPRSLPTPLGTLASFQRIMAYFAGVSNNHPAGHSVVLFAFLFSLLFKKPLHINTKPAGVNGLPRTVLICNGFAATIHRKAFSGSYRSILRQVFTGLSDNVIQLFSLTLVSPSFEAERQDSTRKYYKIPQQRSLVK